MACQAFGFFGSHAKRSAWQVHMFGSHVKRLLWSVHVSSVCFVRFICQATGLLTAHDMSSVWFLRFTCQALGLAGSHVKRLACSGHVSGAEGNLKGMQKEI